MKASRPCLFLCVLLTVLAAPSGPARADQDEDRHQLMIRKVRAENENDAATLARINAALAELDRFPQQKRQPAIAILADPEDHLYTHVIAGALILPDPLPEELAALVPAQIEPGWKLVPFTEVSQRLASKIGILPATPKFQSGPIPASWCVSQEAVDAIVKPSDPRTSARIAICVYLDGMPMGGVTRTPAPPAPLPQH